MAKKHLYNTPGLMPKEWLLSVMHDPTVPMSVRIEVAKALLERWPYPWQYVPPVLTFRIEGLPGEEPRTDTPGPEVAGHA